MAKTWANLTGRQRGVLLTATLAQVVLLAAALRDLHRRPADQLRGPKGLWVAAACVNFIGPLTYFTIGRRR
jgi:hypothetical protein